MKKFCSFLLLALCITLSPRPKATAQANDSCNLDTENADWLAGVLDAWDEVADSVLNLDRRESIWIILLGGNCAWEIAERGAGIWAAPQQLFGAFRGERLYIRNNFHNGQIPLPDGNDTQPVPVAAASYSFEFERPYFVLANLNLWRRVAGEQLGERLPDFFRGVAFHELTHTQHIRLVASEAKQLQANYEIEDALGDNMFEEKFGREPDFVSSYNQARAAWADAIRQPALADKRAAARHALGLYRQRQNEFYGDLKVPYARLEDIFLTMEGAAIWAALKMELDPSQLTDPIDVANHYEIDDGEFAQVEGILMATLAEQVIPDWKTGAFAPTGTRMITIPEYLEKWIGEGDQK